MIDEFIYHIISETEWENVKNNPFYEADSLKSEGFIHFSFKDQVCDTAFRYYPNQKDLLVMKASVSLLTSPLKIDPVTATASFPHLYGPLNMEAVITTEKLILNQDGTYSFAEDK